jgi:hypothetical protein
MNADTGARAKHTSHSSAQPRLNCVRTQSTNCDFS